MKMQVTTTYELEFSVQAFWDEEGGMREESFGDPTNDLNDAIRLLELAKATKKLSYDLEWIIVCKVKTSVT